eukprot:3363567-Alexandrium_andersonii.AAC.1
MESIVPLCPVPRGRYLGCINIRKQVLEGAWLVSVKLVSLPCPLSNSVQAVCSLCLANAMDWLFRIPAGEE